MVQKIIPNAVAAKTYVISRNGRSMQVSMPGLKGFKTIHLKLEKGGVWKDAQGYVWPASPNAVGGQMVVAPATEPAAA